MFDLSLASTLQHMYTAVRSPRMLTTVALIPCAATHLRSVAYSFFDRAARHYTNTVAQVIVAFLIDLASRWEMQPDTQQIHMAFPSKVV